ncbi:MAG: glycosyl hydrolase [Clostridia bacterium]|nr:glycosyl hydrolase [Clostridia bacterium]
MATALNKNTTPALNKLGYFTIILALILSFAVYFFPSLQQGNLNPREEIQIYYHGQTVGETAFYDEEIYLPLTFVKDYLDPNIKWDEKNKQVIITTKKEVFHLPVGEREGLLNLEPYSFTYPVLENGGKIYLPGNPLSEYLALDIDYYPETNIVIVNDLTRPVQMGKVLSAAKLRSEPRFRSSWLKEMTNDEKVSIVKEEYGWYLVQTEDGYLGYLDEKNVELTSIKTVELEKEEYLPWNPLGEKIFLVWEGAWGKTPNPQSIGEITGVQVLSPTWFSLREDGLVKNSADLKYVEWAHQTGRQVWGLFDNGFDPDLTHTMLNDANLRIKVIKQILTYVDLYKLDGINLDFENMHLKDKDAFVQFVRELTPLLHEKDRVVSLDVTFISKSENWSMVYDRRSLGEIVDYMMVMAYDEHGTFSSRPGSVSSLPWVEKGLQAILEQVPNEKVILGVPFYTRLWEESYNEEGKPVVKSQALSMERAEKWLKENNVEIREDVATGQNYAELEKGGVTYKMWLEDEASLKKRIELMKKYRLAGVAAWMRSYAKDEVWPVLAKELNKF